jgi:uncharacterized membrane protein YfcA
MTFLQAIALFIAAMLGGALNSVAGGGSFITLPTLIFTGVPSKIANATSTVALWPGSVASVGAYRKELVKQNRTLLLVLGITSLIGGLLGALLLLGTSQNTFVQLLPYLLLLATVLFAVSGPITTRLRARAAARSTKQTNQVSWRSLTIIALFQLVIATYGGYFGGGIGILMLATLGLMGMENINEMNAVKTVLQTVINGVAVIAFIIAGAVVWLQAIVMIAGAIVGGFTTASFARRLDPRIVRGFVILVGVSMTIYFFLHK